MNSGEYDSIDDTENVSIDSTSDQADRTKEKKSEPEKVVTSEPTEEPTQKPTEKPTATPKPTISPAEKQNIIKEALRSGDASKASKYGKNDVMKAAVSVLKELKFESDDDYALANKVAVVMKKLYPKESKINKYKDIVENYNICEQLDKEMNRDEYTDEKDDWDRIARIQRKLVEKVLKVKYDMEDDISSALSELKDAITGKSDSYKHAYYAVGLQEGAFGMETENEDDEYVIYTHDAFPKSGKYDLNLIPTGKKITLEDSGGFERKVDTYKILSDEDVDEYNRIDELRNDYMEMLSEKKQYRKKIRSICKSIVGGK